MSATVRLIGIWLAERSIAMLRISLGLVILGFGVLKYFPGVSPAEPLVMRTVDALTFGALTGTPAVVTTAVVETVLGLILLTGRGLRFGVLLMGGWLIGIMAPVVLFARDLFPGFVPTLEAQYVLKDLVLAASGAVIAAQVLGARYTIADGHPMLGDGSASSAIAYSPGPIEDQPRSPSGRIDSFAGVLGTRYDSDVSRATENLPGGYTVPDQGDPPPTPTDGPARSPHHLPGHLRSSPHPPVTVRTHRAVPHHERGPHVRRPARSSGTHAEH